MPAARRRAPLLWLLAFVGGAVVLGAAITPPVFWLGRKSVHAGLIPQLGPFGMPTYFRRVLLALFVLGTPWLWRSGVFLSVKDDLKKKTRQQTYPLIVGFGVALFALGLMATGLYVTGCVGIRPHGSRLKALGQALMTGLGVGPLEELIFRGVLLSLAVKDFGVRRGHVAVLGLFATLHFVAPATHGVVNEQMGWLSGFALIADAFGPLKTLDAWLRYGAVLIVLGDALGRATLRTGGLGVAVGLHIGLVFGARLMLALMVVTPAGASLLTPDFRGGIVPLVLMLVLDGLMLSLPMATLVGRRAQGQQ